MVDVLSIETSNGYQGESLVISNCLYSESSGFVVTLVFKDNLVFSNLKMLTTPLVVSIHSSF